MDAAITDSLSDLKDQQPSGNILQYQRAIPTFAAMVCNILRHSGDARADKSEKLTLKT